MKILVGLDGSDCSTLAFMEAISIAKKFSGSIEVVTVYKRGNLDEALKIQFKAKQLLDEEKIENNFSTILDSNPSLILVNIAKNKNFDLIVIGNRGLSGTASFLMGSVSKKVISKADCNVLVVKK